jgi:hypothetical protein
MSDIRNRIITDTAFVLMYAGILYGGWWLLTHPDDIRDFKMRYLKEMEVKSMRNAQFWADRADMYAKAYDGMRKVTL